MSNHRSNEETRGLHLEAHGNAIVLTEHSGYEFDGTTDSWYQRLGGNDFFDRLAETFYQLVSQDDILSPLFDGEWESHASRLAHHFRRMYGQSKLDEAWNPQLLAAHTRIIIAHEHRQRWLILFRESGRRLSAPEPEFTELVSVIAIAASSMMAASRGAALQRGARFDSRGRPA
jgi:hemoglobin